MKGNYGIEIDTDGTYIGKLSSIISWGDDNRYIKRT